MRLKSLEKSGKRAILALLGPVLGEEPLAREDLTDRRLERILVVRQDERLGNVILITPFLEALGRILPHAHLTALVSSRFAGVLQGNPDVDEVIPFDKRRLLRNPLQCVSFFRKLRSKAFDLAIDCGPVDGLSLNNALMTYLSGAPVRLGYLREESRLFLNLLVPRRHQATSEIDYHLDLLRFSFGRVHKGRAQIYLSPSERQRAQWQRSNWGLGGDDILVGMHVGGRGRKRWPTGRFFQLAERLIQDHGVKVILFWGPEERQAILEIKKAPRQNLFVAPPLQIRELASHLESCTVFISGDTGPMHLALAVGTPTISIFRVDNFQRYGRQGPVNRIVYRPGGDVPVADVLAAFQELLQELGEKKSKR
jgi:ADP-heptose:LPS heptosyltransferase